MQSTVITTEQAGKIAVIKQHYEDILERKKDLTPILSITEPYMEEINLLLTVPSIKDDAFTAIAIISEIGVNMDAFPTAKHLCSWAGLTSTNNERLERKS